MVEDMLLISLPSLMLRENKVEGILRLPESSGMLFVMTTERALAGGYPHTWKLDS